MTAELSTLVTVARDRLRAVGATPVPPRGAGVPCHYSPEKAVGPVGPPSTPQVPAILGAGSGTALSGRARIGIAPAVQSGRHFCTASIQRLGP
jgi:hypothetical protein